MNFNWDLFQSIHDEVELTIREKGESKGKRGWRVVKSKELKKINSWKEAKEELGNNGLPTRRIVGIVATNEKQKISGENFN